MKSFIISVIIFAVLLFLIIANSIYVHKICDKMINLSITLNENSPTEAQKLCELWERHRPIFGISIHDSHIERATELIENINSAVTLGNGAELNKNIILLKQLLEEIKQNEEISLSSII